MLSDYGLPQIAAWELAATEAARRAKLFDSDPEPFRIVSHSQDFGEFVAYSAAEDFVMYDQRGRAETLFRYMSPETWAMRITVTVSANLSIIRRLDIRDITPLLSEQILAAFRAFQMRRGRGFVGISADDAPF